MNLDMPTLRDRIETILHDFVAVRSDTNSPHERDIEGFFLKWFKDVPYLKEHPELCGLFPIPNDNLARHVAWCMLKGTGNKTVVMIHHTDCVETSDYSGLEYACLDPRSLKQAFKDQNEQLAPDLEAELNSPAWMFGRGVADMKGGGAIEMALFEQYSGIQGFTGNIIILGVPDEENLSAGMLGACVLLKELKERYSLEYVLMVDTESHERKESPDKPVIYDGSVGKIMPVVYVRGKVAHVGQVYSGLNPINLLADIVRRTELNVDYIERSGNTVTLPATWLYSKDRKDFYDVSLPMDATGYMNILPLSKTPKELMDGLKATCISAFDDVLKEMNESYRAYLLACGSEPAKLPFQTNVKFFAELYQEAIHDSGAKFLENFKTAYEALRVKLVNQECSLIDGVNTLIAVALKHVRDPNPMVIIALAPPFYPSANNAKLSGQVAKKADEAIADLVRYAHDTFGQEYLIKNYYTGISDLSYAMFSASDEDISYIKDNMLLWGEIYSIPLEIIKELSMPVVNIGPWGKDIHKYTERVYVDDLYRVTPTLIHKIVSDILK